MSINETTISLSDLINCIQKNKNKSILFGCKDFTTKKCNKGKVENFTFEIADTIKFFDESGNMFMSFPANAEFTMDICLYDPIIYVRYEVDKTKDYMTGKFANFCFD